MNTTQPGFRDFMEKVKSEIGFEEFMRGLTEKYDNEITSLREGLEGQVKTLTDENASLREAVDEFRTRIARRERVPEGITEIEQKLSRECIQWFQDVMIRKVPESARVHSHVNAEGGFLVPEEWSDEIIRLIPEFGIARRIGRVVTMTTEKLNIGELVSKFTLQWLGENTAATPSYTTWGQLVLQAKKLIGLTYAPEELTEDALIALGPLFIEIFIENFGSEEDRVFFKGDVAGLSDPFDGLLFNADTVEKVLTTGNTGFTDATADDFLSLQNAVPDGAREGGIYMLSPTVLDHVSTLKSSTGNYIFRQPTAGAPATIWGKPYILSEKLPALADTAVSTKFVVFGNPRRFSYIGDRKQIAVKVSDVGGTAFPNVQTGYRVHERVAFGHYGKAFSVLKTAAS